jgi:hypothetical protein
MSAGSFRSACGWGMIPDKGEQDDGRDGSASWRGRERDGKEVMRAGSPEGRFPRLGDLWREHRLLLGALVLALAVTAFFAVRLGMHAVYWSGHRDMPIESWMTIGQVAQSYRVEREDLARALGVEAGRRERLTLAEIAERTGRSIDDVEADLRAAIAAQRDGERAP